MNPYALFAYSQYYPAGGWNDYKGSFETIESALEGAANAECERWHIVDLTTGEIVKQGRRD